MFDWITSVIDASGFFGLAFLMFLENVFPPMPSELIMPLAGFLAHQGKMSFIGAILAGTVGSVAGTTLWFVAARRIGRARLHRFIERHGRWLTMTTEDMDRASETFERHQQAAVFFGRMLPAIRTLISVPAGFAAMSWPLFLSLTTAGSLIWVGFLTGLGYALGSQYQLVAGWVNPVSNVIVGGLVVYYLWRVIRGKGRQKDTA